MKKIMLFAVIGLFTAVSFTSCNKDDDDAEPKSFKVRMTDSPGNYTALNMNITGVDAYLNNSGWVMLSSQSQGVNVAALTNGNEITIADQKNLPSGTYTHLRVKFSSNATIHVNASGSGSGADFTLTWNVPQDIDVVINQQIDDNNGANILLDFNIAQSIIEVAGQYHIQPVITVISDEHTGAKGHVQGAVTAAVVFTNGSNTYSGYINSSGNFLIRGMAAGTYNCTIYKNSDINEQEQVNGVVVTQGQIHEMGNIQF